MRSAAASAATGSPICVNTRRVFTTVRLNTPARRTTEENGVSSRGDECVARVNSERVICEAVGMERFSRYLSVITRN